MKNKRASILTVLVGVGALFVLASLFLKVSSYPTGPYTSKTSIRLVNPFDAEPKTEAERSVERAITKLDFIADGKFLRLRYDGDRTEVIYKIQKVYKGTAPGEEISVFYTHRIKDSSDKSGEISLIQAYQWPDGNFYAVPQGSSFTDGTNSKLVQQEIRDRFK